MTWRVAKSLLTLRDQIDRLAPNRIKSSDGTIGDAAHASRSSDHNPWVMDGDEGVVTALDITHDPKDDVDCQALSSVLVASRDKRIKYVIWNRRIWNPAYGVQWRPYTGTNPHTLHMHISVKSNKANYDDPTEWRLMDAVAPVAIDVQAAPDFKLLLPGDAPSGSLGSAQLKLAKLFQAETEFGPLTEALVRAFQKQQGLVVDGKIGQYTWEKLNGVT